MKRIFLTVCAMTFLFTAANATTNNGANTPGDTYTTQPSPNPGNNMDTLQTNPTQQPNTTTPNTNTLPGTTNNPGTNTAPDINNGTTTPNNSNSGTTY